MASAWITPRSTPSGVRYRVLYRLGGRGSRAHYAGSFQKKRDAEARKNWVTGEIAALRVPDLSTLAEPAAAATLRQATERWRASRIDVGDGTRTNDRVNTERVFKHDPRLAGIPVDDVGVDRWAAAFAGLAASHKKSTLKKSKEAFGMVYDHLGVDPNPLRDKRVKLPHQAAKDMIVPLAVHVEAVARTLVRLNLLPYLMTDWTGLRVGAIEAMKVGDLDEHRQAVLARLSRSKNGRPIWLRIDDDLYAALLASLPPREDRDLNAPLFPGFKGDNLRTAITRGCRHTGTPHFSPHGLRRRRGSLMDKQGYSLAQIAEQLGDTKVITAEHYVFALGDYTEVDYGALLAQAEAVLDAA